MFSLGSSHRYYLYGGHCDMRKSFDGLCGLVSSGLGRGATGGDVFLNRRPTHMKLLHWENIQIASSTIEGWTREALIKLHPLYEQLIFDTKAKGYLQVDESPIKVLDSDKEGAGHQGYYWVYHAPLDGTVLFDYSPTRGRQAPLPILG